MFAARLSVAAAFFLAIASAQEEQALEAVVTAKCDFTINNVVDSVFYNGVDVTSAVSGDKASWYSVKQIALKIVPGAYFVISGHNFEGNSCSTGGFQISCDNGITSNSQWEAYGAKSAIDSSHQQGQGSGWGTPCTSTSTNYLGGHADVKNIFATDDNYASFRILFKQSVVTCEFTIDNVVDYVYYNGLDVTSAVSGDKDSWRSVKQIMVKTVPDAHLVISGHNIEGNSCTTGGFQIQCDNGITSGSQWESYGATSAIDSNHQEGRGSGWGPPCTSTSEFSLSGHAKVKKIFATDGNYASFRTLLAQVPTIKNNGFEIGSTTTGEKNEEVPGWSGSEKIGAWGGQVIIKSGDSAWGGIHASEGDYFLALQGAGSAIEQVVHDHKAGVAYQLEFDVAKRAQGYPDPTLKVIIDDLELESFVPASITLSSHKVRYTPSGSGCAQSDACQTTTSVKIRFWNGSPPGDRTAFIDNVRISEVSIGMNNEEKWSSSLSLSAPTNGSFTSMLLLGMLCGCAAAASIFLAWGRSVRRSVDIPSDLMG